MAEARNDAYLTAFIRKQTLTAVGGASGSYSRCSLKCFHGYTVCYKQFHT